MTSEAIFISALILRRLLVVGLDSSTFDILDPWRVEGRLPNLQRLCERGTRGLLRSTVPAFTPLAWPTLATGKEPGKHGIFEWVHREPESYRLAINLRSHWRAAPIWTVLNSAGLKAGVINFPVTFPPDPVDGFFVSGLNAPRGRPFCYPEDAASLLRRDGPYDVHLIQIGEICEDRDSFLRTVYRMTERQTQATVRLGQAYEWHLLWTVYMGTDWIQHFFWREMEEGDGPHVHVIRNYYEFMDSQLGRLLEAFPDAMVAVISDHGAGRSERLVYANSLLEHLGYLTPCGASTAVGGGQVTSRRSLRRSSVARWVARSGIPARLPESLKRRLPGSARLAPSLADGIDFSRTRAYSYGSYGGIYVNLRGREPQGIVPPEQYDAVCEELRGSLRAVEDPETGASLFRTVARREEIYARAAISEAPDLVVEPAPETVSIYGGSGSHWIGAPLPGRSGDHRPHGLVVFCGEGISSGKNIGTMQAADFAPTLLYLLNQRVPEDMDGHVVEDVTTRAATVEFTAAGAVAEAQPPVGALSAADEAELQSQLRHLGYLD